MEALLRKAGIRFQRKADVDPNCRLVVNDAGVKFAVRLRRERYYHGIGLVVFGLWAK